MISAFPRTLPTPLIAPRPFSACKNIWRKRRPSQESHVRALKGRRRALPLGFSARSIHLISTLSPFYRELQKKHRNPPLKDPTLLSYSE
jgi:hypothetical protein